MGATSCGAMARKERGTGDAGCTSRGWIVGWGHGRRIERTPRKPLDGQGAQAEAQRMRTSWRSDGEFRAVARTSGAKKAATASAVAEKGSPLHLTTHPATTLAGSASSAGLCSARVGVSSGVAGPLATEEPGETVCERAGGRPRCGLDLGCESGAAPHAPPGGDTGGSSRYPTPRGVGSPQIE
eukprot:1151232-Pleurochrysis_carterae.AAC.3